MNAAEVIQKAIAEDMGCDDPSCTTCKYRAQLIYKALRDAELLEDDPS